MDVHVRGDGPLVLGGRTCERRQAADPEAQQKYDSTMGDLTGQKTELEKKIEGLRVYEREYRSRLRSWISDQLSQLDADAGVGEAPTVDAGAPDHPADQ